MTLRHISSYVYNFPKRISLQHASLWPTFYNPFTCVASPQVTKCSASVWCLRGWRQASPLSSAENGKFAAQPKERLKSVPEAGALDGTDGMRDNRVSQRRRFDTAVTVCTLLPFPFAVIRFCLSAVNLGLVRTVCYFTAKLRKSMNVIWPSRNNHRIMLGIM